VFSWCLTVEERRGERYDRVQLHNSLQRHGGRRSKW
jgi:hypothetical protein